METTVKREEYIKHRVENDQLNILRCYFNHCSKLDVEITPFNYIMDSMMEEHPGLEEDITKNYEQILRGFDVFFQINYLVKLEDEKRVLLLAY